MPDVTETGEEGFLAGLRRCGCEPFVEHGVVVFEVVALSGTLAGRPVQTAVALSELTAWPTVPPHWVHLPQTVVLKQTNSQASPHPGWLMHSRNIVGWGNAAEPAQAWIAHVRSVLGEA